MRLLHLLLASVTFLALALALLGCDGSVAAPGRPWHQAVLAVYPTSADTPVGKSDDPAGVRGDDSARLRGKVHVGTRRPNIQQLNDRLMNSIRRHPEADELLRAPQEELTQQYWRVSQDGSVADVVVWLKPPAGRYLTIAPGPPTWPSRIVLQAGRAAFLPHIRVAFPAYRDPENGARSIRTEQKLLLRNASPRPHNVSWGDGGPNPRTTVPLAAGAEMLLPDLKPSANPVRFTTEYPWMTAHVWVFDHPYASVTATDGEYEIDNVPIGVPVRVVAWHEWVGFLAGGKDGTEVTLRPGENTFNFEIDLR
jgi:hypothetical protein